MRSELDPVSIFIFDLYKHPQEEQSKRNNLEDKRDTLEKPKILHFQ